MSSVVVTGARILAEIVGPDFVRQATTADAIDDVPSQLVVEPATPSEVAKVLALATKAGWSVIPTGGGTKLDWGNPPRAADVVLSLRRLDRVLEHAAGDMTATVEAGCTVAALQRMLAEHGQRLALDPLWPAHATVGGVLATGDSGPLRWEFGPVRDLVLGVTVALADGTLARSGGKVVKNVAGFDLPKLFTGSFGTLGLITQATFRLHPIPEAARTCRFSLPSSEAISRFVAAMQECSLVTSAVQIGHAGGSTTAAVRVEGPKAAIEAKSQRVVEAAIAGGAVVLTEAAVLDPWSIRERLFDASGTPSAVARFGLLPAKLVLLTDFLAEARGDRVRGVWLAQGNGSGLIRWESSESESLVQALTSLRGAITRHGGSLVVLSCPPDVKSGIDVWGEGGDALPLIRRVKDQFDPRGTLNPGRFVGGL